MWDARSTEAEGGSEYPSKGEGEGVPSGPAPTSGGDHAHHEGGGERKKRSGANATRDGKNLRKVETIPTNADSGCLTYAGLHKERRGEQHYSMTWVEVNDANKNWIDSTHRYHSRKRGKNQYILQNNFHPMLGLLYLCKIRCEKASLAAKTFGCLSFPLGRHEDKHSITF